MVLPELYLRRINLTFCLEKQWQTLLKNILTKSVLLPLRGLCLFLTRMYGMVVPPIKQRVTGGVFTVIFAQETSHNKLTKKSISPRKPYAVSVKKAGIS